jgi:hypothetical protein
MYFLQFSLLTAGLIVSFAAMTAAVKDYSTPAIEQGLAAWTDV